MFSNELLINTIGIMYTNVLSFLNQFKRISHPGHTTFHLGVHKVEAGVCLRVPGQPGLHCETLSQRGSGEGKRGREITGKTADLAGLSSSH